MLKSKEELQKKSKGYKPEIFEKVYCLLDIFSQILSVEYLKERLVLKGGTALNLFCFDELPRLSVDIDLNYIGSLERETMLEEKPVIIDAIQQILSQNQFEHYRSPMPHAGGKMIWYHASVLGQRSALEIDLNFMYRQPLYPVIEKHPNIEEYKTLKAPVLDIHELAAGKLSALFNRSVSRDLFDAHYFMTKADLDTEKLRQAFVIYLAMTEIDLSYIRSDFIEANLTDLKNKLVPVMHQQSISRKPNEIKQWAGLMVLELQKALATILPLSANEIDFIKEIRNEGRVSPSLITEDLELSKKIISHPGIQWAMR